MDLIRIKEPLIVVQIGHFELFNYAVIGRQLLFSALCFHVSVPWFRKGE